MALVGGAAGPIANPFRTAAPTASPPPPTGGPLLPEYRAPSGPRTPGPYRPEYGGYQSFDNYAWLNAVGMAGDMGGYNDALAQFPGLQQMLMGQIAQTQAGYNYQSSLAYQDNALANQSLDLQMQGLGLDREGIGADLGFLGRREGLADKLLANRLHSLGYDSAQARQNAGTQIRKINNQAEAGGSWFSPERRLSIEDTRKGLANQLGQIRASRSGAQLNREGEQIGFDERRDDLNRSYDQIDLAASQLGIDRQQLSARLAQTLSSLGIQNAEQILGLQGQLGEIPAQQAEVYAQMIQLALQLSMDPATWQQLQYGGTGGGGGGGTTVGSGGGWHGGTL